MLCTIMCALPGADTSQSNVWTSSIQYNGWQEIHLQWQNSTHISVIQLLSSLNISNSSKNPSNNKTYLKQCTYTVHCIWKLCTLPRLNLCVLHGSSQKCNCCPLPHSPSGLPNRRMMFSVRYTLNLYIQSRLILVSITEAQV